MTFSEQTISILDYLCQKFGIVIDWTSDTVWPMVEMLAGKYIKWEIASSILWIVIFVIGITACLWGIKTIKKHLSGSYIDEMWITFCVFLGLGALGFIAGVATQAFDITRCFVFPELELFEFLKETVNSMTQN